MRATAKHLVLLTIAIVLFFWKTLLTSQFTAILGSEGVNYTYSWLHFWISSLWHGQVPLWDPYAFCGRPFAAEMLPSAFYPLHLLYALFPFSKNGLLSWKLYHDGLVLAHLLCVYFTFALIRELRLGRFAAFIGACAFALCNMLTNMLWPPFIEAGTWLPAIFLFLLRALRAEQTGRAVIESAFGGLCLGMSILTGGLHFSIMQGIFVLTAALFYGASAPRPESLSPRSHWTRVGLILLVLLAVGGCAGAVQLLPSYEYGKLSLRYIDAGPFPATEKIPYDRLHPGMWPQSIATVLFPAGFEARFGGGERWAFYVGVFPFFMALVAIWKRWSSVWVRYLAGLAVASFLYTLGEFSPLHGVLYAITPYLWTVRTSCRFVYLASFALALLAAFGMESLLDRSNSAESWAPARRIAKWVAIACGAAVFIPALSLQISVSIWNTYSLLLILASCGWFWFFSSRRPGATACVLLAIFILFDLRAFAWLELPVAHPSKPSEQLEQMISLRNVARFVKGRSEPGRVRVRLSPEPNIGDNYEVQSVWGGGGTVLTGYLPLSHREDLLNVRYIVKPATSNDPGPVYHDARWKVYENPAAFPRGWVVHQTIVEKSQQAALDRLQDKTVDYRRTAVLEGPFAGAIRPAAAGADEPVYVRSYEANRMAIEVRTEAAGLLVLSEMHYPGWRAEVNGEQREIYRVDGGLRGIIVPPGVNKVTLEYVPMSIYSGGALSAAAFLGVLLAWLWNWFKDRRSARLTPQPHAEAAG